MFSKSSVVFSVEGDYKSLYMCAFFHKSCMCAFHKYSHHVKENYALSLTFSFKRLNLKKFSSYKKLVTMWGD